MELKRPIKFVISKSYKNYKSFSTFIYAYYTSDFIFVKHSIEFIFNFNKFEKAAILMIFATYHWDDQTGTLFKSAKISKILFQLS